MYQSVQFVDNNKNEIIFVDRNIISVPRVGEQVMFNSMRYKVRQVYYDYHTLSRDDVCCLIEVNLEEIK